MNLLKCFLLSSALFAKEPSLKTSAILDTSSKSVMVIQPKERGEDLLQAFELLKKEKSAEKIVLKTAKSSFINVTEISLSKGGTLLLIKTPSNLGSKTQVVPIEEVVEIGYTP